MHPEETSETPGKCPKCGMALVKKDEIKHGEKHNHGSHEGGDHSSHDNSDQHKPSTDLGIGDHSDHHKMMAEDFKRRFFVTLPLTALILLLSPQIQLWFGFTIDFGVRGLVLVVLGTIIVTYGGKPFFVGAKDEIKSRNWGMMTLVSLAISASYLFSVGSTFFFDAKTFYWETATLVLVFLFGHWMEMRAVSGTGGALKELAKLIPSKAHKLVGDDIVEVQTDNLIKGDVILIKPGEKVPADGILIKGESSVDESMITGESQPIEKNDGDEVIGGTLNSDGSLTVRVNKTGSESALSQIVELIRKAQESKPAVQHLADKAANWLTITAIVVGSGTFIYWMFINPIGAVAAATFAITVIVITCPHALGLAIPTVTTITSTLAARNGILIRDMKGLEVARKSDYIVFDKTGTLTKGKFGVSKIIKFGGLNKKEILRIAAAVEVHSEHSIAKGVVEEAKRLKINFKKASNFKAIAGKGAKAITGKSRAVLGNLEMLRSEKVNLKDEYKIKDMGTVVYVAEDGILVGAIILNDEIRKESKNVIKTLHNMGLKVAMLTGDKKEVAEFVGKKLGIDSIYSEVLPEDKVNKLKELQSKGLTVAMVGDGVNDAPSLTQAHLGIAIGAGTSVAINSADIVLVKNNLLDVVKTIKLSKKTDVKMKQNLAWATGYNVIAIPVAAGVFASYGLTLQPQWGALLMSASAVIVVANALRLRSVKL